MSAARSRRLVLAGGLSLVLGVAAPGTALAAHHPQHEPKGERAGEQGEAGGGSAGKDDPSGRSGSSGNGESSSSSNGKSSSSSNGKSSSSSNGKSSSSSNDKSSSSSNDKSSSSSNGKSSGTGAAGTSDRGTTEAGDPRGNNGTVKVDGEAFDDGRGNEPHVGCVFSVDFYGFDAGDAATVTLTGHAPTGGGLLHSQHSTISDDAAGGGQDRDATLVFSVQDQLNELLSVPPHPQQGWHVKLAVDVDGAPGGAKQKVFWISCPQDAVLSGSVTEPATGVGVTDVTVAKRDIVETPVAAGGGIEGQPLAGTSEQAAQGASAERLGRLSAASVGRGGAQEVAAQGAVRPQALPFTGAQALGALLVLGLAGLGAGGALARLGRRRAAHG